MKNNAVGTEDNQPKRNTKGKAETEGGGVKDGLDAEEAEPKKGQKSRENSPSQVITIHPKKRRRGVKRLVIGCCKNKPKRKGGGRFGRREERLWAVCLKQKQQTTEERKKGENRKFNRQNIQRNRNDRTISYQRLGGREVSTKGHSSEGPGKVKGEKKETEGRAFVGVGKKGKGFENVQNQKAGVYIYGPERKVTDSSVFQEN